MKNFQVKKQPIHASIARFLGRFGKVEDSWNGGFKISKGTLNGRASYTYVYGSADYDHEAPTWMLRVGFSSRLMVQGIPFEGYMFYQREGHAGLDFDAAANAYEAALFLSGNLPVAAPLPPWITPRIPDGLELHQFAALEGLMQAGYDVGHVVYDSTPGDPNNTAGFQKRCLVIQGDIKRARELITRTFGSPWWSSPEINSRNVVVPLF